MNNIIPKVANMKQGDILIWDEPNNQIIERRFYKQNMLQTMKMQFTAEIYEFTNKNISQFITPAFARSKRESLIKKLKNFLVSNDFQFGSAIIAVKTNSGKFLVIDGNHRMKAFREIIEANPEQSVNSVLITYPTMSVESMKEMMQILGTNVNKQNTDSLFEVFEKNIYVYKNAEKLPFKVSIRNRKNCFRLINLINFLEVKDTNRLNHFQKTLNETLEVAKNSNQKDMDFLINFISFFEGVFGKVTDENKYSVPCFMIPLASIYGFNYEKIIKNLSNSNRRFQNLIQDPEIIDLLAIGGKPRQLLNSVRERQIRVLNRKLLKEEELFE